jgi:methionyl-tRNA synthetase
VHCDHEYLNFKGTKLSKSRGAFVEVPYFLERYDPDALRFYLTATAPETRDTEFSWEDFVERNNRVLSANEGHELVATWGNLSQCPRRALGFMLSFAYKRFDGAVPEPGNPSRSSAMGLDNEDRALLEKVEAGFETVSELYNACKFRAALGEALALAREANGDTRARSMLAREALTRSVSPSSQIKEDRQAAATTVYVILRAVDNLKTILAPILPHTPVLMHRPVLCTGHRSFTSAWATTDSSSAPSTSWSTRRRPAHTGR